MKTSEDYIRLNAVSTVSLTQQFSFEVPAVGHSSVPLNSLDRPAADLLKLLDS